jgi:hypothetical protein
VALVRAAGRATLMMPAMVADDGGEVTAAATTPEDPVANTGGNRPYELEVGRTLEAADVELALCYLPTTGRSSLPSLSTG